MLPKFKPSGKIGLATCVAIAVYAIVMVVVAWFGRVILGYSASFYVIAGVSAAFVALAWFGAGFTCRIGKCRSPGLALALCGMAGVLAIATAQYQSYSSAVQAGAPAGLVEYARHRAATGWRVSRTGVNSRRRGLPVRGDLVFVVWAVEAVLVVGGAALGGVRGAAKPFCEACGAWADDLLTAFRWPRPDEKGLKAIRESTAFETVIDLPVPEQLPGPGPHDSLIFEVRQCPRCALVPTLTVSLEKFKVRKKGKKQKIDSSISKLHEHAALTPDMLAELRVLEYQAAQLHGLLQLAAPSQPGAAASGA